MPLELWDFLVGDQTIWERRTTPEFPEAVLEMLLELRAGTGRTRSQGAAPKVCRDFEAVFVGGGASLDRALRENLAVAPFPVSFSEDGPFACELGGQNLLGRIPGTRNRAASMVVDVGQSQIKVTAGDQRFLFPRDFSQLPIASEVSPGDISEQRARLRSFLGSSLRRAIEASGLVPEGIAPEGSAPEEITPEGIVIALPCEIDDDGVPGCCSYAGMKNNAALVSSALQDARIAATPGFLINDAELAAISARCSPRVDRSARTLVLTLGFGIGAALLNNLERES